MINQNIRNIHVIRGLAALLVVVFHAKFILWCGGNVYLAKVGLHSIFDYLMFTIDMLSSCGKQAVIIFFLLSAFVITHSFIGNPSVLLFFKIRLIRIYLPYIASMILSTGCLIFCYRNLINPNCINREYLTRLVSAYNETGLVVFLKTLVFIKGNEYAGFNFACWSLFHEAIFYILFPLYFKISSKYLAIITVFAGITFYLVNTDFLYYQIFFIFGILIYRISYLNEYRVSLSKNLSIFLICLEYLLINLLVKLNYGVAGDFFTVILFFTAINFLLNYELKMPKILTSLSNQSYSLYLFHAPILMLYFSVLSYFTHSCVFCNRLPYYAGSVLAVLCNIPFYYLFEYQSLKIISKLKRK